MSNLETFAVGFTASFLATLLAFVLQYWLYKKGNKDQDNRFERFKKGVQRTIRRLNKK